MNYDNLDELKKSTPYVSPIFDEINIDDLHNRFGPEGLCALADELRKVAEEDMFGAMNDKLEQLKNL